MNSVSVYKFDFEALLRQGEQIRNDLEPYFSAKSQEKGATLVGDLEERYQLWYSESLALINQVFPARLPEFQSLYSTSGFRDLVSELSYGISTGFEDLYMEDEDARRQRVIAAFYAQLNILKSVRAGFESRLLNIRRLLHADLLDTELDVAKELASNGFARAAGSVAGVALESHLVEVCLKRKIKSRKRRPTIGDWINLLHTADAIDSVMLQRLKGLNEIRSLCTHKKSREPTTVEIDELIGGVSRITKQLF